MQKMSDYQEAQLKRTLEIAANNSREAEVASTFKLGQLVRVCQSLGATLNRNPSSVDDVLIPYPHDHSDPAQHFLSRVVGWDCLGRIEVATNYGDNPHCCDWPWGEDHLEERYGPDWAEGSAFKIGQHVFYDYELTGFSGNTIGRETEAKLIVPHTQPGDWIVKYPREDSGYWITRVLNERQMRLERKGVAQGRKN